MSPTSAVHGSAATLKNTENAPAPTEPAEYRSIRPVDGPLSVLAMSYPGALSSACSAARVNA
jgi:hypothetical protein